MQTRIQQLRNSLLKTGNVSMEDAEDDKSLNLPEDLENQDPQDEDLPPAEKTPEVDPNEEGQSEEPAPEENTDVEETDAPAPEGDDLSDDQPEDAPMVDPTDPATADEVGASVDDEGGDLFGSEAPEESAAEEASGEPGIDDPTATDGIPPAVEGDEAQTEEGASEEPTDAPEVDPELDSPDAETETGIDQGESQDDPTEQTTEEPDETADDLFDSETTDVVSEEPAPETEEGKEVATDTGAEGDLPESDPLEAQEPSSEEEVPAEETETTAPTDDPTDEQPVPKFDDPSAAEEQSQEPTSEENPGAGSDVAEAEETFGENIPDAEGNTDGVEEQPTPGDVEGDTVSGDDLFAPAEEAPVPESEETGDDLFGREEEPSAVDQGAEQTAEVAESMVGEGDQEGTEQGDPIDPAAVEETPEPVDAENPTEEIGGDDLFNDVSDAVIEGQEVADEVESVNAEVVDQSATPATDAENELGNPNNPNSDEQPEDSPSTELEKSADAEYTTDQVLDQEDDIQESKDYDETQAIVTSEVVSTEALAQAVEASLKTGGLSKVSSRLLAVAANSGMGRFISNEGLVLSTESYGGTMSRKLATEASLESLKERGSKLLASLMEIMRKAIAAAEKVLAFVFHEAPRLEVQLKRLYQQIKQLNSDGTSGRPILAKGAMYNLIIDKRMPSPAELPGLIDRMVSCYSQVMSQTNAANYAKLIDLSTRIIDVNPETEPSDIDISYFAKHTTPSITANVTLDSTDELLDLIPAARNPGAVIKATELMPGDARFVRVSQSGVVDDILIQFIRFPTLPSSAEIFSASPKEAADLCDATLPLIGIIKRFESVYRKRLKVQKAYITTIDKELKASEGNPERNLAVQVVSTMADAYRAQNKIDRDSATHALGVIRGVLAYVARSIAPEDKPQAKAE